MAANGWVKFGLESAAPPDCDLTRSTPTSFNGTSHSVTMFGMKAGQIYDWKAMAVPAGGGALVQSTTCLQETAGPLPTSAAGTASIGEIDVTSVVAGTRDMHNVVTHYGCRASTGVRRDDLLVFDQDGEIVWYEDPADQLGIDAAENATMEAISISRPEHTLLAIINHDIIVEYDLAGNLVTVLCRDEGSGYCPLTWDWNDAIGVTVDYSVATCPTIGVGYWAGRLTGQDYMHTNSFWLDVAQQWMFSLRGHDAIWSVDRDPSSSTEDHVIWELDGTGSGGDFTFVSGGYDEAFDGQHHAHWGPSGELVLFDNDNTAGGAPRGMVYDLDATSMTADATGEYTMADASSAAFACPIGGSAFVMVGGHLVATCPETGPDSSKHAVINEFSASNTQVWTLELECDAGGSTYAPSSLAFRAFGNAW